jgi:hypothetical protein
MIPITITSVLTLLSNMLTGTAGLIFAIFSIFAAVLALIYITFDIGNAMGKCGWNTKHLSYPGNENQRGSRFDPNLAYNKSFDQLAKNNSNYLLHDGTYR